MWSITLSCSESSDVPKLWFGNTAGPHHVCPSRIGGAASRDAVTRRHRSAPERRRTRARKGEVRAAVGLLADTGERLSFCAADLNQDAGWREACNGCTAVLHVGSPLQSSNPKRGNELARPARDGALRVLAAARDAGVKRVVMTGALELVTIFPGAVIGPVLGQDFSASIDIVKKLIDGSLPGLPRYGWPLVDVRDGPDLHIRAMRSSAASRPTRTAAANDLGTSSEKLASEIEQLELALEQYEAEAEADAMRVSQMLPLDPNDPRRFARCCPICLARRSSTIQRRAPAHARRAEARCDSFGRIPESDAERRRMGEKLRQAREYVAYSQDEVANFLRVPRTAVTNMESGQRKVDALELKRLAELYRQPVTHFTGDEDEAGSALSTDVAHLARQATALSIKDREELGRFADFLKMRAAGGR